MFLNKRKIKLSALISFYSFILISPFYLIFSEKIDYAAENSLYVYKDNKFITGLNTYQIEELGLEKMSIFDPSLKKKTVWFGVRLDTLEKKFKIGKEYDLLQVISDEYMCFYIPTSFYRNGPVQLSTRYLDTYFTGTNWPKIKKYISGPFVVSFPEKYKKNIRSKPDFDARAFGVLEFRWLKSKNFWGKINLIPKTGEGGENPKHVMREICLRCHLMKGKGGFRGSDFFFFFVITSYMDINHFVKFVTIPSFRDKNSAMFMPRKVKTSTVRKIYNMIKNKGFK